MKKNNEISKLSEAKKEEIKTDFEENFNMLGEKQTIKNATKRIEKRIVFI